MDQNILWEKTQEYQQTELFCNGICYFECIGILGTLVLGTIGWISPKERIHESEIVNVNLD